VKIKKHLKEKIAARKNFITKVPHDGLEPPAPALDKPADEAGEKATPCTALTTPTLPRMPQKSISSTALVPQEESPVEVIVNSRKKFAGKHLPIVSCTGCLRAQNCPQYKPGYQCAYVEQMMKKIGDIEEVPEYMKLVIEASMSRLQQALIFEQLNGGNMEESVSLELESVFSKLERIYRLYKDLDPGKSKQGIGLIEKLFGALMPIKQVEHAEPETVKQADTKEGNNETV